MFKLTTTAAATTTTTTIPSGAEEFVGSKLSREELASGRSRAGATGHRLGQTAGGKYEYEAGTEAA